MMVWGGFNDFGPFFLNTGGRYCAQTAPTISINPSEDNTLYEYVPADGDRSNGVGDYFFAGKTAIATLRRGVLAFDIAGSIPPGSTITSVTLSMHMSRTLFDDAQTVELHKLLADWGEGTSDAPGEEGTGSTSNNKRRHMAASLLRHYFLDDTRRGLFQHGEREPVRWRRLETTHGVRHRWLRMCSRGWTIRQVTSAGWCWETSRQTQRRNASTLERALARLCSRLNIRHPRLRPLLRLQLQQPLLLRLQLLLQPQHPLQRRPLQ